MMKPKSPKMKRRDNHKFVMKDHYESDLVDQYKAKRIGQFTMDCLTDTWEPTPAPVLALAPLIMAEPRAFIWERDINKVS
jgi:hypothetical protein